jgi:N-acetylglucosaminyl-diphospho-decaprenol L-rhamnosyltransferase
MGAARPVWDDRRVDDVGKLGVVAVTYQSAEDLPAFLASLPAAVGSVPYELVVVDNASSDASVELAERAGARVTRNSTNVGLSTANNQGAAQTNADWLLIVNPDTRLPPDSIARLIAIGAADPGVGCVAPGIQGVDGSDYPTGRRFPSVAIGVLHAVFGTVWRSNPATRAYHGRDRRPAQASSVDWVSGSCMVIRREAFDAVGGFDTRYFMYFEEMDICLRLHRAGWKVVLDPSVTIVHREGGSTRHAPFRKVVNHHRGALRFYCRFHRRDPWLLLAPAIALGLAVRAVASLARTGVARLRGRV